MKKMIFLLLLLPACHSVDRLTGAGPSVPTTQPQDDPKHPFITMDACKDVSGNYPSFLPQDYVQLIQEAKFAVDTNQTINGNIYLPMSVDCGNGHHMMGDEYYKGKGL